MKLLIIDDSALFRQGLVYVLSDLGGHVCILEAANIDAAMRHVTSHPDLDLVLLDLHMPGQDVDGALQWISKNHPTLPVVLISASADQGEIERMLAAGAMAYISKASPAEAILTALRRILSGDTDVSSDS